MLLLLIIVAKKKPRALLENDVHLHFFTESHIFKSLTGTSTPTPSTVAEKNKAIPLTRIQKYEKAVRFKIKK